MTSISAFNTTFSQESNIIFKNQKKNSFLEIKVRVRIPTEEDGERAQHLSVRKLEAELTKEVDLGREPENLALKLTETIGEKRRGVDGS